MGILRGNSWLSDEHIDHAQWLLKKQYPGTNCLHSVLAFEGKNPKIQRGLANFVHVLNIDGNPWITVSNIGCDINHVKVYDSPYRRIAKSGRQKFLTSLAILLNTNEQYIKIEWVDMKKQKAAHDSGLFAIASAVCLSNGGDPRKQAFDQSVMREHLALCVDCEKISSFLVTSSS